MDASQGSNVVRGSLFERQWWVDSDHEQIVLGHDAKTGLRAIVAVHSTALGPALGGTRWYPYAAEAEALEDVVRLSEAMTYKAAAAGLALGGGKAVILGDPSTERSEARLEAYGRLIDGLAGRYVTAEDVGTTVEDMVVIRRATPHVTGLPLDMGGSGDPSPATARGVHAAMRAVAGRLWGSEDLAGRTVAVRGTGKVGSTLVDHLVADGCKVLVADASDVALAQVVAEHDVEVVDSGEILRAPCDILAPCALGGDLNAHTIPELRCTAVVGAANNQLAEPDDATRLRERGILYAPDFVVNAGGLINIGEELRGYDPARAAAAVDAVGEAVHRVLELADERGLDTHRAAVEVARRRLASAAGGPS